MIVAKFGGTSVADAGRFGLAARLAAERRAEGCLVVVSALAGVTDALAALARRAEGGERLLAVAILGQLIELHRSVLDGLRPTIRERSSAEALLTREARKLAEAIAPRGPAWRPEARRDAVLAFGEIASSRLFVAALRSRRVPAAWIDPRRLVVTDASHGEARPLRDRIVESARALVLPEIARGRLAVTGGFAGATAEGVTTTLGRGGSDYSAALLGAALRVGRVEIWKDVDGVFDADPHGNPAARLLTELSYEEAERLARAGARVLHPGTVAPCREHAIPIHVRNTFRPEHPGTRIGPHRPYSRDVPKAYHQPVTGDFL